VRAIQIERFGGPEVLGLVDVPDPEPAAGETIIDVHLCGINFADTHRVADDYLTSGALPLIPGAEVVGTLQDGTRAVALIQSGGYAERVAAPEQLTFPVPDAVTDEQALALMLQGTSAWHLLRGSARMSAGESVAVFAAAGGVGSTAVQLARAFGAGRVVAVTSSPSKRRLVESLGADATVDPAAEDLTAALVAANEGRGLDVILEMTGGAVFSAALEALAPFGRLVHFGAAGGDAAPAVDPRRLMLATVSVAGFWLRRCSPAMLGEALEGMWGLVASGDLRPVTSEVYPLADARRAHEDLRARRTVGKIALDPRAGGGR